MYNFIKYFFVDLYFDILYDLVLLIFALYIETGCTRNQTFGSRKYFHNSFMHLIIFVNNL